MNRLLPYAQLVRLPNTFTVWADILLGALATGFLSSRVYWVWSRFSPVDKSKLPTFGQELQSWIVLSCLLAASTLLYWSGMIWNDYFDLDQDRKERPGRPLASGRISLATARWLALAFMAVAVALAGLADWLNADSIRFRSLPIAVALVIAIFLYDGLLKATVLGPIVMGLCRSLNILLGLTILGAWPPFWGWLIAIIIGVYIGGVTWFARTEARMSSQPTLIGAAIAMLAAFVLALTVPALALETVGTSRVSWLFPYLLAGFGIYLGVGVIAAIRRPDPTRVQPVVVRAIMGLVVLDALLASAFVGSLGLLLAVLLIPGMILGRWLYST